MIAIEISPGELCDRYTIIAIKSNKILDAAKRINVEKEHLYLQAKYLELLNSVEERESVTHLAKDLYDVNNEIWDLEEKIRSPLLDWDELGRVAEKIVDANDKRAKIKKSMNETLGSTFVEEKSHKNL